SGDAKKNRQTMTLLTDLPGQSRRRREFLATLRHYARPRFDPGTAAWLATPATPETREWLWLAYAFLDADATPDAHAFASRLILAAPEITSGHSGEAGRPYCVFANTHALHLLLLHGGKLTAPARRRLETWARPTITDNPGGARADLQFHGYNDNMPAKATLGLILGGEFFGDRRALEHGLWNLHQLRLMLARRGVISEHCSPTYSAIPLSMLAEIARLSATPEARELAAACHEHLWAEILAHYHAPTRTIAGPWSRAYATDSAGHPGNLHFLLRLALGPGFVADPVRELLPPAPSAADTNAAGTSGVATTAAPRNLVVHHGGDRFFVASNWSLFAACEQHVPEHLLAWLGHREYPFDFRATAERGEGGLPGEPPAFAAGRITIHSHQTPGYALGTSNGDWPQQAEHWHPVYRRTPPSAPAADFADVRHLTTRYLLNDILPGNPATSPLRQCHRRDGPHAGKRLVSHSPAQKHLARRRPPRRGGTGRATSPPHGPGDHPARTPQPGGRHPFRGRSLLAGRRPLHARRAPPRRPRARRKIPRSPSRDPAQRRLPAVVPPQLHRPRTHLYPRRVANHDQRFCRDGGDPRRDDCRGLSRRRARRPPARHHLDQPAHDSLDRLRSHPRTGLWPPFRRRPFRHHRRTRTREPCLAGRRPAA
ncbi:MAG: hypothetical protein LBK99_10285, partial [Opitutaceae bacterium]|nr:hypothetical protein [Opitutaceae bacterium]